MKRQPFRLVPRDLHYWALVIFLVIVFLTGGSSRSDVQALLVLRPAAIIFAALGLYGLTWAQIRPYLFLFAMAAALFLLVIIHLMPLPAGLWSLLPGRGLIVDIGNWVFRQAIASVAAAPTLSLIHI